MIGILKKHFARYGIPSIEMSDNGPQFVSRDFELFLSNWKVNHATSSPGHQQSKASCFTSFAIPGQNIVFRALRIILSYPRCELCNLDFMKIASPLTITPSTTPSSSRGIAKDVKQLADNCEICQESKPRNCRETLKQHDNGAYPWNKIGLDSFEIKGRNYLIAVDYYSNFIEVDYLLTMLTVDVPARMSHD
jgi:hypothetical protein